MHNLTRRAVVISIQSSPLFIDHASDFRRYNQSDALRRSASLLFRLKHLARFLMLLVLFVLIAPTQRVLAQALLQFPATVPVAGPAQTETVTITITAAGTPNAIQVLTQGSPNLDYVQASGGTCVVNGSYTVGQQYTVNVTS